MSDCKKDCKKKCCCKTCPTGPTGPCCTGPTGPTGTPGTPGITGATGPSDGPQGPQGVPGPQGIQGPQGPQGVPGPQGPEGAAGAAGPQGPQGLQGVQGPVGAQGPQGIAGPPGADGTDGTDGATGATGSSAIIPFSSLVTAGVTSVLPVDIGFGGAPGPVLLGIDTLAFSAPRAGTAQNLSVRATLAVALLAPIVAEIFINDAPAVPPLLVTFPIGASGPNFLGTPSGGPSPVAFNDKVALRLRTDSTLAVGVGAFVFGGVEIV